MASVHKKQTPKGTPYYIAVWRERGSDSTPVQRSKSFNRYAAARAHAERMEAERERRGVGDPDRQTLRQFLDSWLEWLAERGRSPTTIQTYRANIRAACQAIGAIRLEDLSAQDLDRCYAQLRTKGGLPRGRQGKRRPVSATGILNIHRTIATALERARKWRLVSENVAKLVDAPSPGRSKAKPFTPDEIGRLLDAAEAESLESAAICATLLATGIRRGELAALAADACDLDAPPGMATIEIKRTVISADGAVVLRERAKTADAEAAIAIPDELVDILRAQRARVNKLRLRWGKDYQSRPLLMFPAVGGLPRKPDTITDLMYKLMRRAKISGKPPVHGWRHSAATNLLAAGVPLTVVRDRPRHSRIVTTADLYGHRVSEADRAAAARAGEALRGRACKDT